MVEWRTCLLQLLYPKLFYVQIFKVSFGGSTDRNFQGRLEENVSGERGRTNEGEEENENEFFEDEEMVDVEGGREEDESGQLSEVSNN